MNDDIRILEVSDRQHALLEEVQDMFTRMYAGMSGQGLMLDLAEGGPGKWLQAVKTGLGRFGIIHVAMAGGQTAGFSHGSLRLLPDYLGNLKVGVINHVFVEEGHRNAGVGEALVKALEQWFLKQKVAAVELQVLSGNAAGISFWNRLGYHPELLQYRKMKEEL